MFQTFMVLQGYGHGYGGPWRTPAQEGVDHVHRRATVADGNGIKPIRVEGTRIIRLDYLRGPVRKRFSSGAEEYTGTGSRERTVRREE